MVDAARSRWIIPLVVVSIVAAHCLLWADADPSPEVLELIRESQELVEAGDAPGALAKLDEAARLAPDYPAVHANLGYLHEREKDTLGALDSYARLLELRPDDEYGRARVKHLFFGGTFPRALRMSLLQFSPVSFVTDESRLRAADAVAEVTRRIAYTTGMLYPDQMADGGAPVVTEIPSAGGQGAVGSASFNRVCYGYTSAPGSDDLTVNLAMYYPSPLLSQSGQDYSSLAGRLMHVMLRLRCYTRFHLGLPSAASNEMPLMWLCEAGPTGAEQYLTNIFFYDVGRERQPMEWIREAAHEWGHRVLPRMGRFDKPEAYAEGALGELLFTQYLAEEAGAVVGDPWPSAAAQRAAQGLWGTGTVDLADYLGDMRHATLDYWLQEGPNSELEAGLGEDAFMYLVGAMAWVQAAHGDNMLRTTFAKAPGESPADFYYGYRQAIKEAAGEGEITLYAGALDIGRSELTAAPSEGALRREKMRLVPGDIVRIPVYLLDGTAQVRVTPGLRETRLTAYLDGIGPLAIEAGDSVQLGTVQQGWHTLTLIAPEDGGAVELRAIILRTGPQAQAPDLG